MKKKYHNLPLRSGVGIVVLNQNNKVFVAKRIDNPKNFWQMPQGGVDTGENLYEAALRELEEEIGFKHVDAKFRISRDENGTLNFLTNNEIQKELTNLKVFNVETKKLENF